MPIFSKKGLVRFEQVLDDVVTACMERARLYDTSRILSLAPPEKQPELLKQLTHLKDDNFFNARKDIYQEIFKSVFTQGGKTIAPVGRGQKRKRLIIAGPLYDSKDRLLNSLLNKDKTLPAELQEVFNQTNKNSVTVKVRDIREFLPEYNEAVKRGDPFASIIVDGEAKSIALAIINTAKMCGYNIIDMSSSHTIPKSDGLISDIKGIGNSSGVAAYDLFTVGVTGDPENVLSKRSEKAKQAGTELLPSYAETKIRDFAKSDSFVRLMQRSDKSFLLWDEDDKFVSVASKGAKKTENLADSGLEITSRLKWHNFKDQKSFLLQSSIGR